MSKFISFLFVVLLFQSVDAQQPQQPQATKPTPATTHHRGAKLGTGTRRCNFYSRYCVIGEGATRHGNSILGDAHRARGDSPSSPCVSMAVDGEMGINAGRFSSSYYQLCR